MFDIPFLDTLYRTQVEHYIQSVSILKFTHIISFPQHNKLKQLSTELTFR
jgi:hypothetical protein